MQDFTGVPAVVDLAAMRDAMANLGGDPDTHQPAGARRSRHRPLGHGRLLRHRRRLRQERRAASTSATASATSSCAGARPRSRISASCRPAPASATRSTSSTSARPCGRRRTGGRTVAYPDTLVGTDSHTTMINGLAVLGWGVGGIEAEAAMLGQPISMLIPEVIGFRLTGKLPEGVTATDLVLTVTADAAQEGRRRQVRRVLRRRASHSAARGPRHHRQHGARVRRDLRLLPGRRRDARTTSTPPAAIPSASRWSRPTPRRKGSSAPTTRPTRPSPTRSSSTSPPSCPSLAGPKRPQDRVPLATADTAFDVALAKMRDINGGDRASDMDEEGGGSVPELYKSAPVDGKDYRLADGNIVIAAITSLHQHLQPERADRRRPARAEGPREGPHDQAVGEDLARARLQGRHRLPRQAPASRTTSTRSASTSSATAARPASATPARLPRRSPTPSASKDLVVASVLSGNRNFEGRVNPDTRANYLASPPLVVAYALDRRHAPEPDHRAARHGQGRRAGDAQGHLADLEGSRRTHPHHRHRARCSARATPTSSRATSMWQKIKVERRADLSLDRTAPPTCRTRPTSTA